MTTASRDPRTVVAESVGHLALVATNQLYDEQPALWDLGERGRARTLEDFGHHLKSLSSLDEATFRAHVEYCRRLFADRDLPQRWLDDAWRTIADVVRRELPPDVESAVLAVLAAGTATTTTPPP